MTSKRSEHHPTTLTRATGADWSAPTAGAVSTAGPRPAGGDDPRPTDPEVSSPQALLARLENVVDWLRTAKENLPDLNDGSVSADRLVAASALVDRMHRLATTMMARTREHDLARRRAA